MAIYKCKYCNKEFDNPYKLGGHVNRCKLNPNYKENIIHCNNFNKKDKDIQRQNNIINKLNCKFYRYNEYMNLLYEVN